VIRRYGQLALKNEEKKEIGDMAGLYGGEIQYFLESQFSFDTHLWNEER